MALSKKQASFDVEKWVKSEQAGRDLCGQFDFCAYCDKEKENPCAKALDAHKKATKPVAKRTRAKKAKTAETETEQPKARPATKRKTAKKQA